MFHFGRQNSRGKFYHISEAYIDHKIKNGLNESLVGDLHNDLLETPNFPLLLV